MIFFQGAAVLQLIVIVLLRKYWANISILKVHQAPPSDLIGRLQLLGVLAALPAARVLLLILRALEVPRSLVVVPLVVEVLSDTDFAIKAVRKLLVVVACPDRHRGRTVRTRYFERPENCVFERISFTLNLVLVLHEVLVRTLGVTAGLRAQRLLPVPRRRNLSPTPSVVTLLLLVGGGAAVREGLLEVAVGLGFDFLYLPRSHSLNIIISSRPLSRGCGGLPAVILFLLFGLFGQI